MCRWDAGFDGGFVGDTKICFVSSAQEHGVDIFQDHSIEELDALWTQKALDAMHRSKAAVFETRLDVIKGNGTREFECHARDWSHAPFRLQIGIREPDKEINGQVSQDSSNLWQMSLEGVCHLSPPPCRQSVGRDTLPEATKRDHAPAMGSVHRMHGMRQYVRKDIRGGRRQSQDNDTLSSKGLWSALPECQLAGDPACYALKKKRRGGEGADFTFDTPARA